MPPHASHAARFASCILLLALAACGKASEQAPPAPPQVSFVVVSDQPVTLSTQLPARTTAYETSDVRPQVNGIVAARLFEEGEDVRQGQPLYRIDPAPYAAAVASARATLAGARAAVGSNVAFARRLGELVALNAAAKQDHENARTSAEQSVSSVAAAQAALRSAEIDLAWTTIRAPISGRIGRSGITTGALVTSGQTNPLSTIQRLDPMFVDIQQSSADLLRLRQGMLSGGLADNKGMAHVRLTLEDGTVYPVIGTLKFTDVTVDPTTGSQAIRAVFQNPQKLLLPGMFVRAELIEGTKTRGMLVPQQAVTRDDRGQATVSVVGPDSKLQARTIQATRTIGTNWLVTSGVKAGDRVVIQGALALQAGTTVKAVPWESADATPDMPKPALPAQGK
ncbi:MAG: efflux RND transporter periplasmic adaptor subunit [Sphingomonas sp.]